MNEGCATFVHYTICNRLHDKGLINDGAMLEILHSHANVVFQPEFDDPRYSGINPYALGFAMMDDIERICTDPKPEDREWFPEIAGSGDWWGVLKHAWANYRDESFIQQFLSPRLIRKFRLFMLTDEAEAPHYTVGAIHDERGYKAVRESLAKSYDLGILEPDIQVVDVDLRGDRKLRLQHQARDGIPLAQPARDQVIEHAKTLWGYDVVLQSDRRLNAAGCRARPPQPSSRNLCACAPGRRARWRRWGSDARGRRRRLEGLECRSGKSSPSLLRAIRDGRITGSGARSSSGRKAPPRRG